MDPVVLDTDVASLLHKGTLAGPLATRLIGREPLITLNLVAPAFIEFAEDRSGSFGFIAVQGEMGYREMERDGRPGVEFSWEGNDECDPASGRGWAALKKDGSLCGRIFFHLGDDSGFTAVREATEGRL